MTIFALKTGLRLSAGPAFRPQVARRAPIFDLDQMFQCRRKNGISPGQNE
jgi:hypothetical protein